MQVNKNEFISNVMRSQFAYDVDISKQKVNDGIKFMSNRGTAKGRYTVGMTYKIIDRYTKDGKEYLEIINDSNSRWGVCVDNKFKRWACA